MKVLSCILVLLLCLVACSDSKVINGIEYDTYGLLNQVDKKNNDIQYKVCWGNVIWGIILIETVIAPIYFFGFDMFEPVQVTPNIKGSINNQKVKMRKPKIEIYQSENDNVFIFKRK